MVDVDLLKSSVIKKQKNMDILLKSLVHTARFWNNLNQVRSNSKSRIILDHERT
jgi:hypothetical protein